MLNIISSSISSSIYFLKVKIGEWKKRKARWKHAPFVIPFYGCFHLHGRGGGEMREQMSILLLVATRSVLREIHGMEIAGERGKKRLEGIWT